MSTSAKIICDSIDGMSPRITTFQLVIPRFILPEWNTHRAISKNAASSRAIPINKIIEQVKTLPFIPKYWGKNQKGMQAKEEIWGEDRMNAQIEWLKARDNAVQTAEAMSKLNVHKQIANRVLEPWAYTSVVATTTEWDNFFALRYHPDAQPEIKELAELMLQEYINNKPTQAKWHLPYVREDEKSLPIEDQIKISVARCCRVSYNNHDNTAPNLMKDIALHDDLIKSGHMSPTEHQAQSYNSSVIRSGNLVGWEQYRKTINNENLKFNYQTKEAIK